MRSRLIRLLPKTDFNFSALPAASTIAELPLAQNVDVSGTRGGTLMVRVHAVALPTESYFRLDARVVAPTDDAPATIFKERTVATVVAHQVSTSAPSLLHGRLAAGTGAYLSLYLSVFKDKPDSLTFTISVDLLMEEADDDWTPASLGSKLRLWLDQRDLVLVSGAYSDWGDQSAADNGFTQATASLRPASGQLVNYFAAPDFDGTDDLMAGEQLSDYVSASAYHVFVVLRADVVTGTNPTIYFNHGVIADNDIGWWGLYLSSAGAPLVTVNGFHWAGALRNAAATGLRTGNDALVEWSYDGTTIRCQVGTHPVATAVGGGSIGNTTNVVRLGFGANGGLYLNGRIASIIVCNAYLSSGEARSVRDYLASKYGVAA